MNVLILGATSDIAQACAYQFAKEGFSLTLAARDCERLEALKSDIKIKHEVLVNIVEFDAIEYGIHSIFFDNLSPKPDIVLLAFGILGDQEKAQKEFQHAKEIIEANYTGAVSILEFFADYFEQKNSGTIIGISSVAGDRGRQSNYFYGSAKAGLTAYLSGLRNRLSKSKAHVVTVKPGFVATKMTENLPLPAPLTAQPEKVAKAVFKAYKKKKNTIYVLGIWRLIMFIIRNVPETIFKKLKL